MRQWLVVTMLIPLAVNLLMMLLLRIPLRRFQRIVPMIRTADDLSRMKRLAAMQMYAALVGEGLLVAPLLVWVYGKFVVGGLGWLDLPLYVIAPFVVLVIAAGKLGGPAKEVQAISVADPQLQADRDYVVDVWLNRYFPAWLTTQAPRN